MARAADGLEAGDGAPPGGRRDVVPDGGPHMGTIALGLRVGAASAAVGRPPLTTEARPRPRYYPLTLAALVAACNQTSNRDPVVHYDEATVEDALAGLREKALARVVHSRHNRAARHRHVLDEALALDGQELAVLAVLMLR